MSQKNIAQLTAELAANITDNTNQENTAARVRLIIQDIIDSSFNVIDNPITGIKKIGTATIDLNNAAVQQINLVGGTKFLPTDWVFSSPSRMSTNFDSLTIYNTSALNDYPFCTFTSTFNSGDFLNTVANNGNGVAINPIITPGKFAGNTVYVLVNFLEGTASTCKVDVYGYIIA